MTYSLRKVVKLHVIKVLTREEKQDFEQKCFKLNKAYKFCPKGYIVVKEKDVCKIARFGYPIGVEVAIQEEVDYFVKTTKRVTTVKTVTFGLQLRGLGIKV